MDYLVFDDEGHDVLKFKNRVKCYETITEFFSKYLKGEPTKVEPLAGVSPAETIQAKKENKILYSFISARAYSPMVF